MTDLTLITGDSGIALGAFATDLTTDLALNETGTDLATDASLLSAVIVSLFTDRRAFDDDRLPDDSQDRRGWWADAYASVPGDLIGSRLWLLSRERQIPETLNRAQEYTSEALQWLLDDGVAQQVDVRTSFPAKGALLIEADIYRPQTNPLQFRFHLNWQEHLMRVVN